MSLKILSRFLILGCLAFGGPVAHLAWFERTFVGRLKWLTHEELSGLIALSQALPGPASSQTAMGIGYLKGGWSGFWLAWIGFTLPPAVLMIAAAHGTFLLPENLRASLVSGMKVAVVGVIAVALWKMFRSLIRTRQQGWFLLVYTVFFLLIQEPWVLLLLILLVVLVTVRQEEIPLGASLAGLVRSGSGKVILAAIPAVFIVLNVINLLIQNAWSAIPASFYQTGLLVFGGGHVVLPLLEGLVVDSGWVSQESFLFGYGLAQMIPGPLFTFAAFLGAQFPVAEGSRALAGLIGLFFIYLPSFLLLGLLLPGFQARGASSQWKAVLERLHPLVVGLLLAIWIRPVSTSAIHGLTDLFVAGLVTLCLYFFQRLTVLIILATAGLYCFL